MIFNDNCCSKIANMAPAGKKGRLRDRGGGGRGDRRQVRIGGSVTAAKGGGRAPAERARLERSAPSKQRSGYEGPSTSGGLIGLSRPSSRSIRSFTPAEVERLRRNDPKSIESSKWFKIFNKYIINISRYLNYLLA